MAEVGVSEQLLVDEMEIVQVVDDVDNAVDAKDWTACRGFFLDEIDADFTSLAGGSPGRMMADDLVGGWGTNLYSDKKSHHMRTNHKVTIDGHEPEVFSKDYALNILASGAGSDLWGVWGDYIHTLRRTGEGWRISGMSLFVKYARGNESPGFHTAERFVGGIW